MVACEMWSELSMALSASNRWISFIFQTNSGEKEVEIDVFNIATVATQGNSGNVSEKVIPKWASMLLLHFQATAVNLILQCDILHI